MKARGVAALVLGGVLLIVTGAQQAAAHDERPTRTLDGSGTVPVYRSSGPALLVCTGDKEAFDAAISGFPAALKATNQALWTQCQASGHRNLQDAVDAVTTPGVTIKLLPGRYRELPSLAPATGACASLTGIGTSELYHYDVLSLEQQRACPHNQNLVAIIGKKDCARRSGRAAAPCRPGARAAGRARAGHLTRRATERACTAYGEVVGDCRDRSPSPSSTRSAPLCRPWPVLRWSPTPLRRS